MRFILYRNEKLYSKMRKRFHKFAKPLYRNIFHYIYLYNYFFMNLALDLFYFLRKRQLEAGKRKNMYYLTFTFNANKFFINLQNYEKKNFLTLSTGLFIKFFEKRKSFKKNKALKFLMAKYLRKVFLITTVKQVIVIFKKNPLFLLEILNFFNQPVVYKFTDPVEDKIVEEKLTEKPITNFLYFVFIKNQSFVKNKTAQRGRIKRKILRKVVSENKLID